MFADAYPKFIELSELSGEAPSPGGRQDMRDAEQQRNRMNHRYEALFAGNRDVFEGARVLDLASHDGRYSFAALRTGAAHVTGVEVRESLVDRARQAFAFYGQDPSTYRFVQGDVFEALAREELEVDVVLCFGFLYHTYRHTELMRRIHDLAPRHLIIDTMVTLDSRPTHKMILERDAQDLRSAERDPWALDRVLVLRPSVPALNRLVRAYDFEVDSLYDWQGRLAGGTPPAGLHGYAAGKRVSMRCRARGVAPAAATAPSSAAAPVPRRDAGTSPGPQPVPAQPTGGWRERVNRTLARATGYELRRAPDR